MNKAFLVESLLLALNINDYHDFFDIFSVFKIFAVLLKVIGNGKRECVYSWLKIHLEKYSCSDDDICTKYGYCSWEVFCNNRNISAFEYCHVRNLDIMTYVLNNGEDYIDFYNATEYFSNMSNVLDYDFHINLLNNIEKSETYRNKLVLMKLMSVMYTYMSYSYDENKMKSIENKQSEIYIGNKYDTDFCTMHGYSLILEYFCPICISDRECNDDQYYSDDDPW